MSRNWTTADLAKVYTRQGIAPPEAIKTACGDGQQASKFHNQITVVDGITFKSAREAKVYRTLKIAQESGLITDLELQPRFLLQVAFRDEDGKRHRKIEYVSDFGFRQDGVPVVVEVKGHETPVWRLKEKLFRQRYPHIRLEVWR